MSRKSTFVCKQCGEEFVGWIYRSPQFCSRPCYTAWQRAHPKKGSESPNWTGGKRTCDDCGTEIGGHKTVRCKRCENKRRAENPKESPFWLGGKVLSHCHQCGEEIWDFPCRKRQLCNRKCFGVWKSAHWRGENAPVWMGGISDSPYPTEFNNQMKDMIRERDGYRCVLCGSPQGDRLHCVHHINYDKDSLDVNNLVTLCPTCHGATNTSRAHWVALLPRLMAATLARRI